MISSELWIHRIAEWLSRPAEEYASHQADDLDVAFASGINARSQNEDRVAVVRYRGKISGESFVLLVVCDGIGGMREGGRYASLALASLVVSLADTRYEAPVARVRRAVAQANAAVFKEARDRGGTTLSAIFIPSRGPAIAANIGDSRIYQYDPAKPLMQLSVDDNIETQVALLPDLIRRAGTAGRGKQLTQYIGMDGDIGPHSFVQLGTPSAGFLIASDGVSHLDVKITNTALANSGSTLNGVKRVLTLSRWLGVKDNASLIFTPSNVSQFQAQLTSNGINHGFCEIWDPSGKLECLLEPGLAAHSVHRTRRGTRNKTLSKKGSTGKHSSTTDFSGAKAAPGTTDPASKTSSDADLTGVKSQTKERDDSATDAEASVTKSDAPPPRPKPDVTFEFTEGRHDAEPT
jgi:serine/threonine protein phosphatase PrpC